jgi:HEAT repeat protein
VLRPLIVADLASKNEKEVKWALQVVSEVGGKEFLEPVLEVFKKNPACSDAAIYALRGIDDPRAIAALVERHPDLLAVSGVLRSLQRKRPADPALVALLDSKDAKVRSYAASALAESGDPALVGRIEKLLRDENPQVRSGAANMGLCLEKEAYQRIRPAIAALAKDPDPGVRKFVVMCLAQRRDLACGPALLEMARDTNLTQQERYEVVRVIRELTGSYFGFDTSPSGWHPDTPKNREALRRFAEWVEKNSGQQKK